jgi:mono/diheme cytochrome c family protein/rhodanese-related sulfurtransferase
MAMGELEPFPAFAHVPACHAGKEPHEYTQHERSMIDVRREARAQHRSIAAELRPFLVVLILGVWAACSATPAAVTPRSSARYEEYCALCHGKNGEGNRADHAQALNNQDFLASSTDDFLRAAIDRGRPGTTMSAWGHRFGGPLSDADLDALIGRLRAWQREPALDLGGVRVVGDARRAEPVYRSTCAGCHGPRGQGASAPSLNNPVFLATAGDGYLRYATAHGRRGTKMVAYREKLGPAMVDDLVLLIRTWAAPETPSTVPQPVRAEQGVAVLNPLGAPPAFRLREDRYVAAADVYAAMLAGHRLIIADARPPPDYTRGHIAGAMSLPFFDYRPRLSELPRDGTWIVVYCGCPHAESGVVVDALRAQGFRHSAILDEGVFHWQDRGYPMVGSVR